MRKNNVSALAILALAMNTDNEYQYSNHRSNGGQTSPKTTLSKSDQGKRKQKNKSAKKARKQNRK